MGSLPIFAQVESRDGSLSKGAFLKNGFIEKRGDKYDCFRRPGLLQYSTSTAGLGQGITNYYSSDGSEYLFVAVGGALYSNGARTPASDWTLTGSGALTCSGTPSVISDLAIVSFGGILWAIGGNDRAGAAAPRFVVYYSSDDGTSWTKLVDVADGTSGYPPAASWLACVHGGKIYLTHGKDNAGNKRECWYTSNGSTWTQASAATGVTDATGAYVVSNTDGYMYMFLFTTTNPVWKSTNGASWTSAAATAAYNTGGTARSGYGCVSVAGVMYVAGGEVSGANNRKIYSSTNAATWTEVGTDALASVFNASGTTAAALLYLSGVYYLFELFDSTVQTKIWTSVNLTTWAEVGTWTQADAGDPDFESSGATLLANCCTPYCVHKGNFFFNGFKFDGLFASNYVWKLTTTFAGNLVSLGAVGNGYVDFAQDYARTFVMVKSADTAYKYTLSSASLSEITDADYPTVTVRGLVYLDGFFFVMDPDGNIFNSALEDPTTWAAADFIAAEFEPDGGVALAKYQNYIVAFGNYSTEFFYNAGNPTNSPLSPVQNGVMNIGCADGDTVVSVGDSVLFLAQEKGPGSSTTNARFIAMIEGTTYKRISDHNIDRILQADDLTDVEACVFNAGGHTYYHLRLGTSRIALVYDLNQQLWYVWNRRRTSFTSTPSGVVTANGTATYTGTATHSFEDGDRGVVTGFGGTHTALNGTFNMIVPASNTLCWSVGTAYSGTSSGTGTATGYSEGDTGVVASCSFDGNQIVQDISNGNLYKFSTATYRDNGVYMDWQVRMRKEDAGSNERKFFAWADFISDRVSGNVMLRYSDDDSQSFSMYRGRGLDGSRTRWNRLGSPRRRVFDLRVTDDCHIRAERLELGGG